MIEIPYPPVFHDWRDRHQRVAAGLESTGINVDMYLGNASWKRVVLTEDDACLLAAQLLRCAGRKKLSRRVLKRLTKDSQM